MIYPSSGLEHVLVHKGANDIDQRVLYPPDKAND